VIPDAEIDVRLSLCALCPTPCENRPNAAIRCSQCPLPLRRWGTYGRCRPGATEEAPVSRGLGDIVHSVANPIARVIDAVAGTKIANCGSCAERRAALNKMVPKI
jgi:hypothetical protein